MDWLTARVNATPEALALVIGVERWTYRELNRLADRICAELVEQVRPGQIVGALLPNNLAYVGLIHALARMGAVLLPLNTRLTAAELAWQLELTACQLVVVSAEMEKLLPNKPQLPIVRAERLLESGVQEKPVNLAEFNLDNDQAVIFTSGTSGRPKGARITFSNHFWSAAASAFRLGLHNQDLWLSCLPLYHVGGLAVIWRSCLYGTAVSLHPRFDVTAISNDLDNNPITLISLTPTMVYRLLDYRGERPWPATLRHLLLGGAAATPDLVARCHALGIAVTTTYGLTEAASQAATMPPDDVRCKPGSVGKPLMFTRIDILDETGRVCAPGEVGEIVISGPTVMAGYYRDAAATAVAIRDNKLYTGDMGYLDTDGDLWLVQRRSDLIVSGGENVYPAEVEAVLRRHPAVATACVVGIPHPEWGQQTAAAVVLAQNMEATTLDLQNFCRENLAGYKIPRLIRFVPQLPQTASGKIARSEVQQLLQFVR